MGVFLGLRDCYREWLTIITSFWCTCSPHTLPSRRLTWQQHGVSVFRHNKFFFLRKWEDLKKSFAMYTCILCSPTDEVVWSTTVGSLHLLVREDSKPLTTYISCTCEIQLQTVHAHHRWWCGPLISSLLASGGKLSKDPRPCRGCTEDVQRMYKGCTASSSVALIISSFLLWSEPWSLTTSSLVTFLNIAYKALNDGEAWIQ